MDEPNELDVAYAVIFGFNPDFPELDVSNVELLDEARWRPLSIGRNE